MSSEQPNPEVITLEQNEQLRSFGPPPTRVSDLACFIRILQEAHLSEDKIFELLKTREVEETKRKKVEAEEETKRKKVEEEEETKRQAKKLEMEKEGTVFRQVGMFRLITFLDIDAIFEKLALDSPLYDMLSGFIGRIFGNSNSKPREISYHRLSLRDTDFPNDNLQLHIHDQSIGTLKKRKK